MRLSRFMPALLAVAVSCSDGTSVTDLVGLYEATEFTVTDNGTTTDWLAAGATVQLILNANQTSAGSLFVPGGAQGGGDLNADLSGTWTINDGKVYFEQDADTFIRNMPFSVVGEDLVGDQVFGTARVRITLTRQ